MDPDINLLSTIDASCSFFPETEFVKNFSKTHGLSVIHFNARRLVRNFEHIKQYLQDLNKCVDVIAISETWLNETIDDPGMALRIIWYNNILCC